jgi:hypothetical protein
MYSSTVSTSSHNTDTRSATRREQMRRITRSTSCSWGSAGMGGRGVPFRFSGCLSRYRSARAREHSLHRRERCVAVDPSGSLTATFTHCVLSAVNS